MGNIINESDYVRTTRDYYERSWDKTFIPKGNTGFVVDINTGKNGETYLLVEFDNQEFYNENFGTLLEVDARYVEKIFSIYECNVLHYVIDSSTNIEDEKKCGDEVYKKIYSAYIGLKSLLPCVNYMKEHKDAQNEEWTKNNCGSDYLKVWYMYLIILKKEKEKWKQSFKIYK